MDILIDHYESPVNKGHRPDRLSIGKYCNPHCNRDIIAVQITPDGIWWTGTGCITCLGAASLLAEINRTAISADEFVAATGLLDPVKRGCILTPWLAMQDATSINLGMKHAVCRSCEHWQGLCVPLGKLCEAEKVWQNKRSPPDCCPNADIMATPLKLAQRA